MNKKTITIISVVVLVAAVISVVVLKEKKVDNAFVQTCVTYCDGGKYEAKENKGYCVCPDGYEIEIVDFTKESDKATPKTGEKTEDVTPNIEEELEPTKDNKTPDPVKDDKDKIEEEISNDFVKVCSLEESEPSKGKLREELRLTYDGKTKVIKKAIGVFEATVSDQEMFNHLRQNARKEFCPDVEESKCEINISGNVITATIDRTARLEKEKLIDDQVKELESGALGKSYNCR